MQKFVIIIFTFFNPNFYTMGFMESKEKAGMEYFQGTSNIM